MTLQIVEIKQNNLVALPKNLMTKLSIDKNDKLLAFDNGDYLILYKLPKDRALGFIKAMKMVLTEDSETKNLRKTLKLINKQLKYFQDKK